MVWEVSWDFMVFGIKKLVKMFFSCMRLVGLMLVMLVLVSIGELMCGSIFDSVIMLRLMRLDSDMLCNLFDLGLCSVIDVIVWVLCMSGVLSVCVVGLFCVGVVMVVVLVCRLGVVVLDWIGFMVVLCV